MIHPFSWFNMFTGIFQHINLARSWEWKGGQHSAGFLQFACHLFICYTAKRLKWFNKTVKHRIRERIRFAIIFLDILHTKGSTPKPTAWAFTKLIHNYVWEILFNSTQFLIQPHCWRNLGELTGSQQQQQGHCLPATLL